MTDIRDIKPPVGMEDGPGWGGWLLGAFALATVGLAVWRWRRGHAGEAGLREVRAGLARLAAEDAGLDDRTFYYRLAELLRRGIEARWGFAATAMTSEEILDHLVAFDPPRALMPAVTETLGRADLARYAGFAAENGSRAADLATARNVVGSRRP
jgi:hypothetical protein